MKKIKYILFLFCCTAFCYCGQNISVRNSRNIKNFDNKILKKSTNFDYFLNFSRHLKYVKKKSPKILNLLLKGLLLNIGIEEIKKIFVMGDDDYNIYLNNFIKTQFCRVGKKCILEIPITDESNSIFYCPDYYIDLTATEIDKNHLPSFVKLNTTSNLFAMHPSEKGVWDILVRAENPYSSAETTFTIIAEEKTIFSFEHLLYYISGILSILCILCIFKLCKKKYIDCREERMTGIYESVELPTRVEAGPSTTIYLDGMNGTS